MDIKEKIEELVEKISKDEKLQKQFKDDPVKALEKLLDVDLPDAVIEKIVDILEDMALEIEEMEESVDTLNDYAEELDEDLGDVEDYLFGDDECDCDCCDDDCDCDCDCCDDGFLEIECPKCGEIVCLEEDFDADEIVCPACNEKIEIDD